MFLVKSRKSLLRLQILIQRQRMLPVDIDLPIVRECDSEVGITECNDLLVGSRRLMFKLVAREIQNLKSLWTVLLVNALQLIVLRRKSAFGRRVDYQNNFSFILAHAAHISSDILCLVIIKSHMCPPRIFCAVTAPYILLPMLPVPASA